MMMDFLCLAEKPYFSMSIIFIIGSAIYSGLTNNKISNEYSVVWQMMEAVKRIKVNTKQGRKWRKYGMIAASRIRTRLCLLDCLLLDPVFVACARLSHFQTKNFTGESPYIYHFIYIYIYIYKN